jgi:hypothetical protein
MHINTVLTYPEECRGEVFSALKDEMVAANKLYQKTAANLCRQAITKGVVILKEACLEAFLEHTLDTFEEETVYQWEYLCPHKGPTNFKRLAAKILLAALLHAPLDEGLDDTFITEYLETTHEALEKLILKKTALDETAQEVLSTEQFAEDETKVG